MAWLLRIERPGHKFSSRALCSGADSRDDMENNGNTCKSLLGNGTDDCDFNPSLPQTPNLNGTDFTKHKVGGLTNAAL